jgi:hypothetical protein
VRKDAVSDTLASALPAIPIAMICERVPVVR